EPGTGPAPPRRWSATRAPGPVVAARKGKTQNCAQRLSASLNHHRTTLLQNFLGEFHQDSVVLDVLDHAVGKEATAAERHARREAELGHGQAEPAGGLLQREGPLDRALAVRGLPDEQRSPIVLE